MTVLDDRIAMAESDDEITLDELFERIEKMPAPEGYKVEIVEGTVVMAPQRDTRWEIIAGLWRHQDVEFVAEVISRSTAANDYGLKKAAYAQAEVPVYLIADPYQRRCHVYTNPKGDDYATETKVGFGDEVDLTATAVGLTLKTDEFPVD
ncbi:Uma2 family endonuclease [Streptomyces sp. NPDC048409]|uniref:Uma2 family endonuclease n=1 Tax=Streptomyces sp. NPDC048409 TaxID=3154723 RepID=UPI003424A6D4